MERSADPSGARGSNAGDQFHELWALEQILALLDPRAGLTALTVEGVAAEPSDGGSTTQQWEGVDCALYYGGKSLGDADRVELVQLKYSTDPSRSWSVPRLTKSTAKKVNNSALYRLSQAFVAARGNLRAGAQLRLRFTSNQPVAGAALEVVKAGASGQATRADLSRDLKLLESTTGLVGEHLTDFLATLDLSECGGSSRFAMRERVILKIAGLIEDNAASVEAELRQRVRELMLPERSRDIVTTKTVLSWFQIADPSGLFPCPPAVSDVASPVIREAAARTVALLTSGARLVCIHGPGGCGKTTVVQELADILPAGSSVILFDCYGAGRYRFSDDRRHLPNNAFLQLANDLAVKLRTPFFVPRDRRDPVDIRRFLERVAQAAAVVASVDADALLVFAVDAADNAVTAARLSDGEPCFVHDLCGADLQSLPPNVRVVLSARTAQVPALRLPTGTAQVECTPFSLLETTEYVRRIWPDTPQTWVVQFHELSRGVPRVQSYAVNAAHRERSGALDALRPNGKGLKEVLSTQFEEALRKIGQEELFGAVLAGLAVLPPPIPPQHLAAVARTTAAAVTDLVHDLSPGLRLETDGIVIADEDFEDFIKGEANKGDAGQHLTAIKNAIASELLAHHKTDPYAATHVAEALVEAARGEELLPLLESDSSPKAIADPIVRREVQLRRFRLALTVCRRAGQGHMPDCLKVILLSADAERDEDSLRELLTKEIDLAVYFAWPTLRRLVLTDRHSVVYQGSVLARDAARAVRQHDPFLARERLASYEAWLQRRRTVSEEELERWTISDDDLVARAEAIFELAGTSAVIDELGRWRPRDIPLRVAVKLVPALLALGRQDALVEILNQRVLPDPWNLFLAVPLSQSGHRIPANVLGRALARLRDRMIPKVRSPEFYAASRWQVDLVQLFVTACELGVAVGVEAAVLLKAIRLLRSKDPRSLTTSETLGIDVEFRTWLLERHLTGQKISSEAFLAWLESEPGDGTTATKGKPDPRRVLTDRHDELKSITHALYPVYAGRLALIVAGSAQTPGQLAETLPAIDDSHYRFDGIHWSTHFRQRAAESVMQLMAMPGLAPGALFERAVAVLEGRYKDPLGRRTIPLLERLLLRNSEHASVHKIVMERTKALRDAHVPSSEKAENLILFSRLLLPASPDDARELFTAAVEIAKEVDREAYDQIELLGSWSRAATALDVAQRREVAGAIYSFVSGAAERVSSYYDGFPWWGAASSLTQLSLPVAFASLARWADDGTVGLDSTLPALLATGLRDGSLSPSVVTALTVLLDELDRNLIEQILGAVKDSPAGPTVREEVARDCLLRAHPGSRELLGREILTLAPQAEISAGGQLSRLQQTVQFLEGLRQEGGARPGTGSSANTATGSEDSAAVAPFAGLDLTDPRVIQEALQTLRVIPQPPRLRDLLIRMRDVVPLAQRVAYLDAVARVELDPWDENHLADALVDCLSLWSQSPAVERWRVERLPSIIVSRFAGVARWLKEGHSSLPGLLKAACLSPDERLKVIAEGVEASGLALGNRALYGVAELMVSDMSPSAAGPVLPWYVQRLVDRIPPDDRRTSALADVPSSDTEAAGRFVYALLSDIDTRIRWRAAHAVRRLARLGATEALDAVIGNWPRVEDKSYRDPDAPFYWLAVLSRHVIH